MVNLGCMVMEKLDVNLTKSVDHENEDEVRQYMPG
jgi:hypothetical protein